MPTRKPRRNSRTDTMKANPEFNVLVQDSNHGIIFKNVFSFGRWEAIKKVLTKAYKTIKTLTTPPDGEEYSSSQLRPIFNELVDRESFLNPPTFHKDTYVHDYLPAILKRECLYHFRSKCEYEVVVQTFPGGQHSRKINVYDQFLANWVAFSKIALKEVI